MKSKVNHEFRVGVSRAGKSSLLVAAMMKTWPDCVNAKRSSNSSAPFLEDEDFLSEDVTREVMANNPNEFKEELLRQHVVDQLKNINK